MVGQQALSTVDALNRAEQELAEAESRLADLQDRTQMVRVETWSITSFIPASRDREQTKDTMGSAVMGVLVGTGVGLFASLLWHFILQAGST